MDFREKRSEHVTPLLISVHWLPIKQRIEYKLTASAFRYFDGTLPLHLANRLSSYTPRWSLRSSSDEQLSVPSVNLKTAGASSSRYQVPCLSKSDEVRCISLHLSHLFTPASNRTSPALPPSETLKLAGGVKRCMSLQDIRLQWKYSVQLYCLSVEKFAFWLVICIKTFNKINTKTSTTQRGNRLFAASDCSSSFRKVCLRSAGSSLLRLAQR